MLKIRTYILVFAIIGVSFFALLRTCNSKPSRTYIPADTVVFEKKDSTHLFTIDEAIEVARANASKACDVSLYKTEARLEDGIWFVDFILKDRNVEGGGAHYQVSEKTGKIISGQFDQ